jgi:Mn-dependent DtxR family transcriptional regulator
MGRKANPDRVKEVVEVIRTHDGKVRANDIAKELELHPQTVSRLLAATDDLLTEDDRGFLGIFKKRR